MKILKKILILAGMLAVSTAFFSCSASKSAGPAKFTKGLNLSKWFETWNGSIPNLKVYDKQDFVHLKEIGCDVVRVPVHFASFLTDLLLSAFSISMRSSCSFQIFTNLL